MIEELAHERARKTSDPDELGIETTDDCGVLEGIIGQERAVEALKFGLDMPDRGFNVYVAGRQGTGKTTAVKAFLEERAKEQPVPPDWCYVNNFKDQDRPKALKLPAGRGKSFQEDVSAFVDQARKGIQEAFESDEYSERKAKAQEELESRRKALMSEMEKRAREAGFLLQVTPMGIAYVPLVEGKPMDQESFMSLEQDVKEDLEKRQKKLQDEMGDALKEVRKLTREARERIRRMDRDVALYVIGPLVDELLDEYGDTPEVSDHLKAMKEDMLDNIDAFRAKPESPQEQAQKPPWVEDRPFRKYEVNVIVDNSEMDGAPVVTELNPIYPDLFGRIEKEAHLGALRTDFTLIRGGSLHRANGGYLVIQAQDLLRNPYSWDGLKRAIRNLEISIEEIGERLGFISTRGLRPEPIPLHVKVVLTGNPRLYFLLYELDEDFNELFKVKADFDVEMDRTDQNVRDYLCFVSTLCRKDNLRPLGKRAAAKVVEFGSRQAGDQEKLSTHFGQISDLIREANFWADKDGSEKVSAKHVQRAVEEKIYRSNLIQVRIQELVERGRILIDTTAEDVGQVNGLAIMALGDYIFGRPRRITASVGMGKGGIIDIEREAKLGGNMHTKGILILSGYLSGQYAQNKPLSLSARLVFEQSYEGIDGDSASSTELYALLSALSGVPIKQGIAVTGSVNQNGEVQAIGGVNEKIEGFFELCKAKKLNGEQGVMIPRSNAQNLMLKEDVVEAIREGRFHVWPVGTIDEGIEVLTGVEAGVRGSDGRFPEGSVHGRADKRLRELAEGIKSFGQESGAGKKNGDEDLSA